MNNECGPDCKPGLHCAHCHGLGQRQPSLSEVRAAAFAKLLRAKSRQIR